MVSSSVSNSASVQCQLLRFLLDQLKKFPEWGFQGSDALFQGSQAARLQNPATSVPSGSPSSNCDFALRTPEVSGISGSPAMPRTAHGHLSVHLLLHKATHPATICPRKTKARVSQYFLPVRCALYPCHDAWGTLRRHNSTAFHTVPWNSGLGVLRQLHYQCPCCSCRASEDSAAIALPSPALS